METTDQVTITQETESDGFQRYELAWWLQSSLSPEERAKAQQEISSLIEKAGGRAETGNEPELRAPAYLIGKETQGYFATLHFSLPPENVAKLERALKLHGPILRHLVAKWKPPAPKAPTPERVSIATEDRFRPVPDLRWSKPTTVGEGREPAASLAQEPSGSPSPPTVKPSFAPGATEGKPEVSLEEIEKKIEELLG